MSRSDNKNRIKSLVFFLMDAFVFAFAFMISFSIRHGFDRFVFSVPLYRELFLWIIIFHVVAAFALHSYHSILIRGYIKEMVSVIKHCALVFVLLLAYMFFVQLGDASSRLVIALFCIFSTMLIYLERLLLKWIVAGMSGMSPAVRSALLVTVSPIAASMAQMISRTREYTVCGVADFSKEAKIGEEFGGVRVVSDTPESALEYIRSHWVDEVFVILPSGVDIPDDFYRACREMGVTVSRAMPKMEDYGYNNRFIHNFGGVAFITSSVVEPDPMKLLIKRIFDICGGLVGLVLTAVLFVIFAPIILLQSPGPIFFSQTRVGRNGKTFKIYKFRTMYADAEKRKAELMEQNKMNGLMFKVDNDPRITPIGRFLRNTSIDEFPQFLNVLLGQMSLVGTRPPTVDEYEQYDFHHKIRLAMRPGITGMWQVSGRSDITDFEEVVSLDKEYIEKWSLSLDIKIMFKTVFAVLAKKGAE